MRVGSLFAGIGGFDLGFERAGFDVSWQVELNPFCRRVLGKHWPSVRKWDDVRTFPPEPTDGWRVDVICGGFPCQDISNAGNVQGERDGIDGERSGLWSEYLRIVRVLRPRYVAVENVAKLLDRGLGRVLGDLAENGYDAEWACIPAAAFGAVHIRDRMFLLAYADSERVRVCGRTAFARPPRRLQGETREWDGLRLDLRSVREGASARERLADDWCCEPGAVRDGDGLPGWVDRRRALGNAIDPRSAEWIARRIREHASKHHAEAA